MKAKEVMDLLHICRNTLCKYSKNGNIKYKILPNGRYDYDEESVHTWLNKDINRKNVIYSRVSTTKQKKDLENQITWAKTYCLNKGIKIDQVFKDIASGIDYTHRKEFFELLDQILNRQICTVVITSKDRLTRIGFSLLENLCKKFSTKIEVIDSETNTKTDSDEIFEEIITLLHCFAMKFYSSRKFKKKIQEGLQECN